MPVRLKKGVVPTIFDSIDLRQSDLTDSTSSDDVNVGVAATVDENHGNSIKCIKQECELMRIEYENLKAEHFQDKMNHHVEISRMEMENERLKSIIRNQTSNINRLNHKVTRTKDSNNSLSLLLQDLKKQKILSEEASNVLQVCYSTNEFIYALCTY